MVLSAVRVSRRGDFGVGHGGVSLKRGTLVMDAAGCPWLVGPWFCRRRGVPGTGAFDSAHGKVSVGVGTLSLHAAGCLLEVGLWSWPRRGVFGRWDCGSANGRVSPGSAKAGVCIFVCAPMRAGLLCTPV